MSNSRRKSNSSDSNKTHATRRKSAGSASTRAGARVDGRADASARAGARVGGRADASVRIASNAGVRRASRTSTSANVGVRTNTRSGVKPRANGRTVSSNAGARSSMSAHTNERVAPPASQSSFRVVPGGQARANMSAPVNNLAHMNTNARSKNSVHVGVEAKSKNSIRTTTNARGKNPARANAVTPAKNPARANASVKNPARANASARKNNTAYVQASPVSKPSSVSSTRVGDLDRAVRAERARKTYRRYLIRIAIVMVLIACLVGGGVVLYFSDAFHIEEVEVEGVSHLTASEMEVLANVPSSTTLLRVDTATIESNLLRDAWVQSASIERIFPNTLKITITERTIAAVVEVPTSNAVTTQEWAIASDGTWLMAIPSQDSELGQSISQQIYTDAENALHITDVPYGTTPEIGSVCKDDNVNNALSIVSGMTTELADQVVQVKATDAESTLLTLESGVEIAFGKAENIRDKERVCLEILSENPDTVAYINVRTVDRPTWRAA